MITIRNLVESELRKVPFLSEYISDGIINISSLARRMEPKISSYVGRKINTNAIIMTLKRMEIEEIQKTRSLKKQLKKLGDITVRSGLIVYNFSNSEKFEKIKSKFNLSILSNSKGFHALSKGVNETTIIISENLRIVFEKNMKEISFNTKKENLASITIELPKENTQTIGLYYSILGAIAQRGLNLVEVISTTNELTVILHQHQVAEALETLMNQKK